MFDDPPPDQHKQFLDSDPIPPPSIFHGYPNHPPTHPTNTSFPTPPSNSKDQNPFIHITKVDKYSEENDPPMVDLKVTNPVTYLKRWFGKILKNEGIRIAFSFTIKPLTAIFLVAFLGGGGFSIGSYFFPHSSPILHREIMYQGVLQKTSNGVFLNLPNSDLYALKLKPNSNINFENLPIGQTLVKGNLTAQTYEIEVAEILPLNSTQTTTTSISSPPPITLSPTAASQNIDLPLLYSNLIWEKSQEKLLLFTSGKRRIEQQGVYLESSTVVDLPQDFINYYVQNLTNTGFKQILNSADANGLFQTFAKNENYITFGVKYVYQGSGEKKHLSGYRAYIEHN